MLISCSGRSIQWCSWVHVLSSSTHAQGCLLPSSNPFHQITADSALPEEPYSKCAIRSLPFWCDETGFRTSEEASHFSCSFGKKVNTAPHLLWLTIPYDYTRSRWKLRSRPTTRLLTVRPAPRWESCCWNWLSLSRIFKEIVFPIPCKALVESQLARAWNAGWLFRGANQGKSVTDGSGWTSIDLLLQFETITWHSRSSKWVIESTATSKSGDCIAILGCVCDACSA